MNRDQRADTAVSSGDFELLVQRCERPLGQFVAQMVARRSLAEDVLQETFLVAWRERARMPVVPEERRAWLYGIARNQALHALRKGRRAQKALSAMESQVDPARSEVLSEALAMRDLIERELSPSDRSLFVLRYVHGFSAKALADMTGLRSATVRKRLERSSSQLRAALHAEGRTLISPEQEARNEQTISSPR